MSACLSCLQVKDPRKMKLPSSPWKALNSLGRSDRPAEDLHDRLGIQSDTGNYKPLHETGRGGTMSDGFGGRDL